MAIYQYFVGKTLYFVNARNNSGLYWWPLTLAGKEDRIKFLDWCIRQVELQIKYETQKNKRFIVNDLNNEL